MTDRCRPTPHFKRQRGARVNAIISSSVTEWTPEGMLKDAAYLLKGIITRVIAQSVFQQWKDVNKAA